jgi:hypothetical protein
MDCGFKCLNVGMHGGGLCGLCLWWWMCGQGDVWVWCESSYEVVAFDEFVSQLTRDRWEVLMELLWCDISTVSDLLINVFIDGYGWGGWWVGHYD